MAIQQGQQALASDFVASTAGVVDAGKAPKLNAEGLLDNSFLGLTGIIVPSLHRTAPPGWLLCQGQAVSRAAYAALFAVLCPSAAFTVSIASPAAFTSANHGLVAGDRLRLTTTGALPTGLLTNTDYYIIASGLTANEFRVSASRGGAAVNTSGSQSGAHTWQVFNCGAGDGSTTFNLPNFKGRTIFGYDPADANFDAFDTPNSYVGEKTHQLTAAELASHTHQLQFFGSSNGSGSQYGQDLPISSRSLDGSWQNVTASRYRNANSGNDAAHNNMPPYKVVNFLIRT